MEVMRWSPNHPPFLGGAVGRLRRWFWLLLRYPGELCQDCGGRYDATVWWADDTLWSRVVGQAWERQADGSWAYPDGSGGLVCEASARVVGLLCPACFGQRAEAVALPLKWRPEAI